MLLKKVSILTLLYDTICIDIVCTFYPFRLNYGKATITHNSTFLYEHILQEKKTDFLRKQS